MNPLLPAPSIGLPQLSSYAAEWDWLFVGMVLLALFFIVPIIVAIGYFAVKYRKTSTADRGHRVKHRTETVIELSWALIPFALTLVFYVWAAKMYVAWASPPKGALEIDVIGKQWMWKVQHPGGQREINTLHVPMGRPVKLLLSSEDVIHSLYLPALRIKDDAIPGRYTTLWFQADKTGEYRIECTEFCGTDHSRMVGRMIVLGQADYQAWLSHAGADLTLAQAGEALFRRYGCSGCHGADAAVHAPSLGGLYGAVVHTADGRDLVADDQYIRDSILQPKRDVVVGYRPIMPSFQGQIGEDDLLKLIAFIRSLPPGARP